MTTPKPLTADEVADIKALTDDPVFIFCRETVQELIATIEQQAEQIEKLRAVIYTAAVAFRCSRRPHLRKMCDETLAATEPVNDKR